MLSELVIDTKGSYWITTIRMSHKIFLAEGDTRYESARNATLMVVEDRMRKGNE